MTKKPVVATVGTRHLHCLQTIDLRTVILKGPHTHFTHAYVCVKILRSVMKSAAWLDLASPEGPTRAIAHLAGEFYSPLSTAKFEIVLRLANICHILVE